MTYEEFLQKPKSFIRDMLNVMNIKIKYQLEFTEQEKEINQYLLQHDEETRLNELRGQFEKCWEIDNT
jgi:hypothetical protein